MKNSTRSILIILLITKVTIVSGQQINIGSQCPDVLLTHIINYKTTTAKISDFRGKLLIIDYWATWCNPCVGMIPKTDSLQKQFAGKVQILPVTDQDENLVRNFYNKYNNIKHILPYSVTEDTVLKRLFKPNEFPHYIWINPSGKVIAETGLEEVNAPNIQKVLDGFAVKLTQKKLKYKVDISKPYFSVGTPIIDSSKTKQLDMVPQDSVVYHSIITKYHGQGYNSGVHLGDSTRISAFNFSIKGLYKTCIGKFQYQYLFDNLVLIESKDSALIATSLYGPKFLEWQKAHSFCYELVIPPSLAPKRAEIMTEDLNKYFGAALGIEGVMEKRMTKCMVLKKIIKEDKLASKNTGNVQFVSNQFYYKISGGYMINFMMPIMMDLQTIKTPLIDGTGYVGKIDLELNCNTHNIQELNVALEKYGLKFVEEDHLADFIVIRDKSKN